MITHIQLKKFKCFSDESFDIAPLTLFTGINGMGKSSVIQSLVLLRQSYESTLLQTKAKVDLFNHSYINLESASDLCNYNAYPKSVEIIAESSVTGNHHWTIDASKPKDTVLDVVYEGNDNLENEALFKSDFIYLTADRFGPRKSYNRKVERVFNTKLGVQGELTPTYISDAVKNNDNIGIENLKHPTLRSFQLYENLNAWLSEILGRNITTKVTEIDQENVKLSFNLKGTRGGDFSALQVGFGFSFSLPVILAPLIAKPGDLLIIENPEAHLHPSAQAKIGKLLALAAQNGVQIIIESHSDHLLNGIRLIVKGDETFGKLDPGKVIIHFFNTELQDEAGNFGKRTLKISPKGKLDGWPNGFFDEWESNLRKLLK
jgi:predicted ATPase